jgi:hypothetical protein
LHQVLGLTAIKNELRVRALRGPATEKALPPLQQDPPPGNHVSADGWRPVESMSRRPGNPTLTATQLDTWRPTTSPSLPARDSTPALESYSDPRLIVIPFADQSPEAKLAGQVERMRLADDRFRDLRVQVTGDQVILRGSAPRWWFAVELAESISRLPGVKHVSLDDVEVSR